MRKNAPETVTPRENNGSARAALDDVYSAAYEELRRLAAAVKRRDGGQTLSPTALVNEAWIRLARTPAVAGATLPHFKRIAARAMRQLLVEAARRRRADKRGGGEAVVVQFDDGWDHPVACAEQMVDLDEALCRLAHLNPRQAQIVESRFFGGLEVSETARMLEISEATVHREWRVAKAWLAAELRSGR
jgi:RNA polymerase sigma-70 factor, ECF subfamily